MQCRVIPAKTGAVYPVKHVVAYHLPNGLPEGTPVEVLDFDHGMHRVRDGHGREWSIFALCVETGYEYCWRGKWLPADDPRVIAERERTKALTRPAHL